ncbi:PREDICTED: polycomb group protein EMBRYONIC FLOWER 2-like isoform X2 [Nelumbo nucifera]|uniref:Polycomb group protein EMBRYONIC FLOWER 2-like n=2 Tax=Nelumbo nucifera TaxID=4432 RepID=A0A822ZWI0_NELNU|nr:PREDICTED: polycomb group protein EMBRYONIC FLOWER 2-like isoform X2 [Nelumbo nucifera]DAD47685.1 TPA_asm: hypothetical protein HUJ06_017622 [Nelumbo nucifera]
MPGLPLVASETTNPGCNCSHSRSFDQMCCQDAWAHLSAEEAITAEESLSVYCKPVELYNILQRRALRNPSFLQRCLHYRIQAKHKRSINEDKSAADLGFHGIPQPSFDLFTWNYQSRVSYRLRTGNVIFNYRYYNNMLQKTEVTEDFSCTFCLVPCASFKGLRCHLCSSHDLFNFEFWVTEEYQAVNVSVKTDIRGSEIVADGIDPRLQTFFFCSKPRRRKRSNSIVQNAMHVHPQVMKLDSPEVTGGPSGGLSEKVACTISCMPVAENSTIAEPSNQISCKKPENGVHSSKEGENASKAFINGFHNESHKTESNGLEDPCFAEHIECVASSPNVTGVTATAHSSAGLECSQPVSGSNTAPPLVLQFAKTRKLSAERSDPRNRALLQKRQFFHSHRAQPMALEQVLSDQDSEDEVDDDIADFEDRRMLDDFVDVTKDEKQIMHLWNSFVRKQRVLADGHIPWACEAFSRLHGKDLVRAPNLIRCWRLFMIKLWNHSLLDARTMNNCNIILERYENEGLDPKQS